MPETRRAVVIEDDPDIRGLLVHVLVKHGFLVTEAAAGLPGIEVVRSERPDLVTLDLSVPDLDGLEVCKRLREFSDAFIVVLTARADELDKLTGPDNGADDYISKPFSPRELQSRIGENAQRAQHETRGSLQGNGGVKLDFGNLAADERLSANLESWDASATTGVFPGTDSGIEPGRRDLHLLVLSDDVDHAVRHAAEPGGQPDQVPQHPGGVGVRQNTGPAGVGRRSP